MADIRERVASYPFWYHTLELPDGVVTPGAWDLRPLRDRIPWPDVAGKRCLDVGTFDGFFAFELERRGAREVVATDVPSQEELDWPWDVRPGVGDSGWDAKFEGTEFGMGRGFHIAAEALESKVQWKAINIYDLSPDRVGTFDVVTCGSLLLHLRDPIRALEAIRSVCTGVFVSSETLDTWLTLLRRVPVARFQGKGKLCQWWNVNAAAHVRWLESAGFQVVDKSRPYVVPYGVAGPRRKRTPKIVMRQTLERAMSGMPARGLLHRALVARPLGP